MLLQLPFKSLCLNATNGFPTTRACQCSFTPTRLPFKAATFALFEKTFSANGWPPQWRYGVYSYHHYHTEGHEVLGIASGQARLMLGGPDGHVLEVSSGDVLLLPAGTGHCNLDSSEDFLVVGAYPPGQHADICREAPTKAQQASIDTMPFPEQDPVQGLQGAVQQYWVGQR